MGGRPGPSGKAEGRERHGRVGRWAVGHVDGLREQTQTSLSKGGAQGLSDMCLDAKDRSDRTSEREITKQSLFHTLMQVKPAGFQDARQPVAGTPCSAYLTLRETPCGTPMLTAAPRTLWLEIFRSAPYSTTVPKKPALRAAGHNQQARAMVMQSGGQRGLDPFPSALPPPTRSGSRLTPWSASTT